MYMADVIAFFFAGRFNWIRKMFPERSVMMSLIILISQETVEKLEWAALLWILVLAKARSAAPISAAISAKRATQASAKINATLEGARQKGSWLRRLLVTAPCGDAPRLLLAICPSASTRDQFHFFKSLLCCLCRCDWFPDDAPSAQALDFFRVEPELLENFVVVFSQLRRSLCRYFCDAVYLNRTTDCKFQVFSRTFERDDDVVSL